ncbi:hypothetical protein L5515_016848 [Caenorhabditis briggsae]|uniref:MARVEL domain-containing protein n=3 Tax=Caenorhabditis briggsae TaxID=6238 RepID=A0AAE9F7X1_CAEBR|nr:hypothetical protein L3Y34_010970 [Caenorhabditis briggsae]UMM40072.1 hypothetical protein L5515_016848 [Caenorhabditis briggsae]
MLRAHNSFHLSSSSNSRKNKNMTKYIRVKETYCGCVNVQYIAIIASCATMVFQLTFSIFFLIYGQLWGLIPMALTILSHLFFMIIIHQFKSTISVTIYSGIEIAFAFTILGFSIWILSWVLDPKTAFIYYFCVDHLDSSCYGYTQIVSLIWGCLFIIFFFASVLLLPIFRSTWRNIKVTRKSSSVYIDDDNKPTPAVQPIFNINSGPTPVAQPVPQQIMLPPQLLQQYAGPQVHQVPPAPASQQQTQIPQRPQQLYPAQPQTQNIMTPSGVIHLNLYTIQLPNGNNTYVTTSPIIDQLSTDCFESISQTDQIIDERL